MKRLLLILWLLTAAAGSRISAAGRTELNQGWKFRQYGLGEWLPAAVPGTVHTDLLANGQIPDPFYGSSQSDLQWMQAEQQEDGTFWMNIDVPEFNYKTGEYHIDVYLVDADGNQNIVGSTIGVVY